MCADDDPGKAGYPYALSQVAVFNLLRQIQGQPFIHPNKENTASNLVYTFKLQARKLQHLLHCFIVKEPE
jgi:hypothetical protein